MPSPNAPPSGVNLLAGRPLSSLPGGRSSFKIVPLLPFPSLCLSPFLLVLHDVGSQVVVRTLLRVEDSGRNRTQSYILYLVHSFITRGLFSTLFGAFFSHLFSVDGCVSAVLSCPVSYPLVSPLRYTRDGLPEACYEIGNDGTDEL